MREHAEYARPIVERIAQGSGANAERATIVLEALAPAARPAAKPLGAPVADAPAGRVPDLLASPPWRAKRGREPKALVLALEAGAEELVFEPSDPKDVETAEGPGTARVFLVPGLPAEPSELQTLHEIVLTPRADTTARGASFLPFGALSRSGSANWSATSRGWEPDRRTRDALRPGGGRRACGGAYAEGTRGSLRAPCSRR